VGAVLFEGPRWRATEVGEEDLPGLQRFFEENPEYFLIVEGGLPGPGVARKEYEDRPPAGWGWDGRWLVRVADPAGAMVAVADVVRNLLAPGVWHIGLFVVAARLHGTGEAESIYRALEDWMRGGGARWLRLVVALGNARAGRFWDRMGYSEVRRREGVLAGRQVNTMRMMVKPLAGEGVAAYLERVPRDRGEAPQPG
jgi:ribosomal protein S18 acetylase RimI-like enzyme